MKSTAIRHPPPASGRGVSPAFLIAHFGPKVDCRMAWHASHCSRTTRRLPSFKFDFVRRSSSEGIAKNDSGSRSARSRYPPGHSSRHGPFRETPPPSSGAPSPALERRSSFSSAASSCVRLYPPCMFGGWCSSRPPTNPRCEGGRGSSGSSEVLAATPCQFPQSARRPGEESERADRSDRSDRSGGTEGAEPRLLSVISQSVSSSGTSQSPV